VSKKVSLKSPLSATPAFLPSASPPSAGVDRATFCLRIPGFLGDLVGVSLHVHAHHDPCHKRQKEQEGDADDKEHQPQLPEAKLEFLHPLRPHGSPGGYIFSGALTPRIPRALRRTCPIAFTR